MVPLQRVASASQPVGNASTSVQRAIDANQRNHLLKTKSIALDKYLQILRGTCPVCFAVKGRLVDRHQPMVRACGVNSIPTNWWKFKHSFELAQFSYCYRCGVPAGPLEPICHKKIEKVKNFTCPWDDYTFVTVFALWHHAPTQQMIKATFGLDKGMEEPEFIIWVAKEDKGAGMYHNYLEVFLWYCYSWESRR